MTDSPSLEGGLRTKAVPQQPQPLASSCITIFAARVLSHCAHCYHWEIIIVVWTDPVFIYISGNKNTMRKKSQGWNFNPNASFGMSEVQIPPVFPVQPSGWAAAGTQPRGCSRTLPGHAKPPPKAQAGQIFPGVGEVNTTGRNPFRKGKYPQQQPDVQGSWGREDSDSPLICVLREQGI